MAPDDLIDAIIAKLRHDNIDVVSLLEHLKIELKKSSLERRYLRATTGELARETVHHTRELVKAKSRRLAILELKQAIDGNETDPSIILEIEDLKGNLELLWQKLNDEPGKNE